MGRGTVWFDPIADGGVSKRLGYRSPEVPSNLSYSMIQWMQTSIFRRGDGEECQEYNFLCSRWETWQRKVTQMRDGVEEREGQQEGCEYCGTDIYSRRRISAFGLKTLKN